MNIFQIECFVELANCLNFTKASETLFIAQPALSRTISAVETEIGTPLVLRNTRKVALTAAGETFLEECRRILQVYNEGITRTKLAAKGYGGELRLGLKGDTFKDHLVDIVMAFCTKYPDVNVKLSEYNHLGLLRAYGNGEVDMINDSDKYVGEESCKLAVDSFVPCVIVSKAHPLAARESIMLRELRDEKFILMSRLASPGYGDVIRQILEAGYSPNVLDYAEHIPGLLMMVACNNGVSILPSDLAGIAGEKVSFIPIAGAERKNTYLLWKRGNKSRCLQLFADFIRKELEMSV